MAWVWKTWVAYLLAWVVMLSFFSFLRASAACRVWLGNTLPEPVTEKVAYERVKKKHPGRNALPENIPVEEITETLDYKPPILLKRRYIRRKYAVKNPVEDATGNIVIADLQLVHYPKPSQKLVYWLICGLLSLWITCLFIVKLRCSEGSLVGNGRITDKSTGRQ